MGIDFIDLKAQYACYKEEIDQQIAQTLQSAQFIGGSKVIELEKNLTHFTQSPHAIACSSGTDALVLALLALDIGANDEVIVPSFTFIATAEAVAFLGAKPVFCDANEEDLNIDIEKIKPLITSKTRAIIPVSLYGLCANMTAINDIAKNYGLAVIEDAAQSFGATFKGQKSCNLSDFATTSFFPAKPLGCYGDGGAVFCRNKAMASKIRILLNHGQNAGYQHSFVGINGRLDAIQAGVLNVKLKYYDQELEQRQEVAKRYIEGLKNENIQLPKTFSDRQSVFAQFTLRVKNREDFAIYLQENGIPTAVYYPFPLHKQEVFLPLNQTKNLEVSEHLANEVISLPLSAFLSRTDQNYIVETINNFKG